MKTAFTDFDERPLWLRYVLALFGFALALAATTIYELSFGRGLAGFLLVGVAFSSWFGGAGPWLLISALSSAAYAYFFLPRTGLLLTHSGWIQLGVFVALSAILGMLQQARRRSERRLRMSERQYRLLFDRNPDPMWVYDERTLHFLAVNEAAVNSYGYAPAEWLRMTIRDIRPPQDVTKLLQHLREHPPDGPVDAGVWTHRKKDGSLVRVEITHSGIRFDNRPARLVLARDVTMRLAAEDALRRQSEQLRVITDSVPALISYVDRDIRYQFINHAYEAWFGRDRDNVLGRHMCDVLGEATWEAIQPYVRQVLAGEAVSYEQWLPYRDGGRRYVSASYVPQRDTEGQVQGFYVLVTDLTARRQAEEALQRSESLFRTMAESSPLGIFVADVEGQCTYTNRVYQEVSGLDNDQALGTGWAQAIHPEDRAQVFDGWNQFVDRQQREFHAFHRFQRPDGTVAWTSVRAVPIHDAKGFSGYIGTAEDITEFRRAEQELRRRIDQLQTAYRMTEAVSRATAVEAIYEEALEGLQLALKADRASILLLDDAGVMRFKAWRGLSDKYRAAVEGHSAWAPNAARFDPVLISDVSNDPSLEAFHDTILGEGIRALGFIALVSQGRLLGKLMIYYDQPYRFRKEDVELAQNMASQIAFAIERRRVEEQIQAQGEQLEAIVTSVPGVVWEARLDAEGVPRLGFVSEYVETLLGYTADDTRQPGIWRRILHPDDQERVARELSAINASGQGGVVEARCVAKDGRTVWVEVRSTVILDPLAKAQGMRGVAMDITDRKRTEEALRDSRSRLAGIISSAMDAIITVDQHQRVVVFNAAAERMFRFPADRAIGQTLDRFVPAHLPAANGWHAEPLDALGASRAQDTSPAGTVRLGASSTDSGPMRSLGTLAGVRADGEEFPIEATISQVDSGDQRLFTVIIRDITERVRAERRLAAQHSVTRILAESPSLDEAMPKVLETVCRTLSWDVGAFWSVDPSVQGMRCQHLWQRPGLEVRRFEEDSRQRVFGLGRGLPGRVWAAAEPAWVPDATQEDNFPRAPFAIEEGLRAAFAVPIMLAGKVLGVMEFFSHEIQQPDQDLLRMMSVIGSQIGQFIERRRAEDGVKASLAEKEVLLKEIHHRVKNNMQVISSLLSLQADHIQDPKVLELFEDSQHRIQSMALVHETLYQSRDLSQVNLGTYLRELVEELWSSYGPRAEHARLSFQADNLFVGIDTAIPCGLILNELVSNALKHAFPDGREGQVRIRLRKGTQSRFMLTVQDTGVGLPEAIEWERAETLGLRLVRTLTEQLSGTLTLERADGTSFTVECSGLKHQANRQFVEKTTASKSLL